MVGSARLGFEDIDAGYQYELMPEVKYYVLNVESEDGYGLVAHLLAEEELIHEDIPLLNFDAVKPQIEKLIEDGRIRKVHNVRLGYVVYLENDHNTEHYQLLPSWVVECEYYPSSNSETLYFDDQPDYSIHQQFRKLVINAQTGQLIDPTDRGPDRSNVPEIIAWDQAQ